jgi:hypothetical protein
VKLEGNSLILETVGEHFVAADSLKNGAQLLDDQANTAGAKTLRSIEVAVRMRGELAAVLSGIDMPNYATPNGYTTKLHDSWMGEEVLSALRIAVCHKSSDPVLAQAAVNALENYNSKNPPS